MKIAFTTCVQLGKSCIEEVLRIGGHFDLFITLKDEQAKQKSGRIYLDELAEKAGPGAEGLTMLPHLCGSTMPVYNPDARGAFWGMTLAHGKGHFARAILESVAFTLKDDLECIGAEADEGVISAAVFAGKKER